LNSSIGITWENPPPAAPPFIPNVGPWEGWRTQANVFLPNWAQRLWALIKEKTHFWDKINKKYSPIVVVDLPSPNGVGLIPATTTYFPSNLPFNRSKTFSDTFALLCPYNSNSSGKMPISEANRSIPLGFWAREMSISDGTG
jgi:hypothetical protein